MDEVATALGRIDPGRIGKDRGDLSYQRFFVSKPALTGKTLAELPMPEDVPIHVLHVRRYDVDLVPSPDLMLEIGDRVGVLVAPGQVAVARAHFGDTVKAAADFSYVSIGLGMVMGVLLGLVPVPVPGVGTVTLGIGGGPLIVALIFGRLRRTGPLSWVMPLPANIVLRNFGLTLFLATVGINSGQAFVTTVAQTGPLMLLIGAAVLLTTVAIVLLVGFYLLKIPSTTCSASPPAPRATRPSWSMPAAWRRRSARMLAMPMIFPSATIVKVIAVQVVGLLALGG
ncbi:TrkA C-terminal domain-containing protein [Dankookia sp. P2]|uniref:aspartate-alanine antiporter-like transporter n=1 Tax=Dankookia sp. P2 TaxID=3423955 RepID=UPI003D672DC8